MEVFLHPSELGFCFFSKWALEEISTQIPCHHVLANEISLNLKYSIGLKHFFNINLGIGIIKKTTFLFVFLTYIPVFLLKFRSGELVGCGPHPMSTHSAYFWQTPLPQKQEIPEKTWWWCHHHFFSGISCFWDSRVHQKYAVWVLVGCGI